MPEVRDKRRKTDLDLFVLAMVDSGVSTPYALQISAGISPGASIPVLQRLTEAGLVRQGKPGSRGRTEHWITAAGGKLLKTGWRSLIEEGPSGDLDSDLRVALLALASGERRLAKDFLERSAARKLESISGFERPDEPDSLKSRSFGLIHLFDTLVLVDPETLPQRLMTVGFERVQVDVNPYAFRFRVWRPRLI